MKQHTESYSCKITDMPNNLKSFFTYIVMLGSRAENYNSVQGEVSFLKLGN
jgi:hypothetical protein